MGLRGVSRARGPIKSFLRNWGDAVLAEQGPSSLPGTTNNSAVVLHGIKDLRFENFPLPDRLAPGNVRLAVNSLGICGSDVHFWQRGRIGDFVVTDPMVIGHEVSGTVVARGSDVQNLKEGDRCAIEPGFPCCWASDQARQGRYNMAPDVAFFATPPVHGALSEYVDHPADFCYRLPDNLTTEDGALCEPLSVGLHASRRGEIAPGKGVLIMGAGPIGLAALLSARAFGADQVIVADIKPDTLALAQQLGATGIIQLDPKAPPREAAAQLKGIFPPYGPDIIMECAGFESSLQTSCHAVKPAGRIVAIGMGNEEALLPACLMICKEIDFIGSFRYANTYPLALRLMASGQIDAKCLITHRLGFSEGEVARGFDTALHAAQHGAIKVMFNLDQ